MPPKPKFTKEEIVAAALDIVSEKGIEGLTARELGEVLGSSARPIFTVFKNMEELCQEVAKAAMLKFESYSKEEIPDDIPLFKQIGMKMVMFGMFEPKLYQLLFMHENCDSHTFGDMYGKLGVTADICIEAIQRDYKLNVDEAKILFENMWIYTFGIGALCATKVCSFTQERIGHMLTTEFQAMMTLIKSGKLKY